MAYEHQEYPKHQYNKDGQWCICLSAADDKALGKEWTDKKPAQLNEKATTIGDIKTAARDKKVVSESESEAPPKRRRRKAS